MQTETQQYSSSWEQTFTVHHSLSNNSYNFHEFDYPSSSMFYLCQTHIREAPLWHLATDWLENDNNVTVKLGQISR